MQCCDWSLRCIRCFCNPVDCGPPGTSVRGILQARRLEWVAISFSRGSSRPTDQTRVSCFAGDLFTSGPPGSHTCTRIHSPPEPPPIQAATEQSRVPRAKAFLEIHKCTVALRPLPSVGQASGSVSLKHLGSREGENEFQEREAEQAEGPG